MEEVAKVLARAESFRLIAACFYAPKKEILGDPSFFEGLNSCLKEVCPSAATFIPEMQKAFEESPEEDLLVEHARLFVGPFELVAPPYGSIYLDEGRQVMGPSTMATIRFYEEEGLSRDAEFTELPDHIAVELEFMYYLAYKEAEAIKKGETEHAVEYRRKQEEFHAQFVGRWIPIFCEKLNDGTESPFYKSLAACVAALVTDSSRVTG